MAVFARCLRPIVGHNRLAVTASVRSYVKSLYEDELSVGSYAAAGTVEGQPHLISAQMVSNALSGNVFTNHRLEYGTRRYYRGRVKGVVFDWGGTVVDCGVFAPIYTFIELFKEEGVDINEDEARAPTLGGKHQRVHIAEILEKDAVKKRWIRAKGVEPTDSDIQRMYDKFIPQVLASLTKYSNVINGVSQTVNIIRKQPYNLRVGSTTGYPKQVLNVLLNASARQGFIPDASVCLGEVPEGKPSPYMLWLCALRLAVFPIEAIVKVDDSISGIHEGLLAGCWTVGITKTSSYVGLTETQLEEINPTELEFRLRRAYDALTDSGAHYVIDSIIDLPSVINDINRRLASGERP